MHGIFIRIDADKFSMGDIGRQICVWVVHSVLLQLVSEVYPRYRAYKFEEGDKIDSQFMGGRIDDVRILLRSDFL